MYGHVQVQVHVHACVGPALFDARPTLLLEGSVAPGARPRLITSARSCAGFLASPSSGRGPAGEVETVPVQPQGLSLCCGFAVPVAPRGKGGRAVAPTLTVGRRLNFGRRGGEELVFPPS